MQPLVRLSGVGKSFGQTIAVEAVSLDLDAGRFLTILGPSGCGKTTLLRMIAGFIAPSTGHIEVNGSRIETVRPGVGRSAWCSRSLRFFPTSPLSTMLLTLAHAAFSEERHGRAGRAVSRPGPPRRPRLRVGRTSFPRAPATARRDCEGVGVRARLRLLDEPWLRSTRSCARKAQLEFRRIQRELGVTTINVTHDQREALVMSDEVMVMHEGRVQQSGAAG